MTRVQGTLGAFVLTAALASAQSAWPSYPNNGAITISSAANVGIGTTATDAPFVVSTSAWNTPVAYISTSISGGGLGLYSTNTNTAARNWGIVGNFINFGDFAITQSGARAGNPFADATTPKFYMTASGNVGVGTVTPASKLHLLTAPGTNFADGITLQSASTSPGDGTSILWTDSAGAEKARVFQTAAGNSFRFESAGPMMFNTAITGPTGTNQRMVIDTAGNVGIGTTAPAHLLHVAGTIGAQEIIVSSTGADYVFDPAYRLRPLKDVAAYIKANRHLPDIPAADEVKEKGMSVREMESKLLAKIEELTLHMIEANDRINGLARENQELRQQIQTLSGRKPQ